MDDDKGGGDEDVEADGWEEGAGDQDIVVRNGVAYVAPISILHLNDVWNQIHLQIVERN